MRRYPALLVALIVFTTATAFSVYKIAREYEVITDKFVPNLWVAAQAEIEYLRFVNQLLLTETGGDAKRLKRRLAVLESRLPILLHGAESQNVRAVPGATETITDLAQELADLDERLAAATAQSLPDELARIRETIAPFEVQLHGIVAKTMQKDEEVAALQREGVRRIYWQILFCFAGIVASALALVFVLLKLFRNVTQLLRKAQAAELVASEAQRRNALLATALDNAGDAIEITDSAGRFEYVNPAFERISGYSSAEALGQTPMSLLMSGRDDEPIYCEVDAILRSGRVWQGALTAKHKNGQVFQQEATISPVRNAQGSISHFVAVKRDITDDLRARQIWHLAHHDPLTGLPNRTLFSERLDAAMAAVRRRGDGAALLCVDLDHFKDVNDTFGHAAGDELLKIVAARLQDTIREVDTAARIGGDEFAIIQVDVHDPGDVENLCRRLLARLGEPVRLADQEVLISPSIGVAALPEDGSSAAELLQHADIALYRAKAEGRNTFRFFAPEMDLELQERRALEQDLRQALGRGELDVHYQPLVDVVSRQVVGVEAPDALASSHARCRQPRRLHPDRRDDRPHPANGRMALAHRLPAGDCLVRQDHGRQSLAGAVPSSGPGRPDPPRPRGDRAAGPAARAGDHRRRLARGDGFGG